MVGETSIAVEIVHLAFSGAGIVSRNISLQIGQHISLRFMAKGMALPAVINASVRSRKGWGDDGSVRYGLLFRDPADIPRKIPTRLLGAFNRRRSFRVVPRGEAQMAQLTRQDGVELQLPIISLSTTGIACLARTKDEEMLMAGDVVTIRFLVPETKSVCSFVANVRYGSKQRGGVRYGMEFDRDKSQLVQKQQRIITRYVMQEQRRMLNPD